MFGVAFADFARASERRNVLREILATEESYLGALTVLVNQFQERLGPLLSETELENVFMGCKELLAVHGLFFGKLCLQVPSCVCVSRVLGGFRPSDVRTPSVDE